MNIKQLTREVFNPEEWAALLQMVLMVGSALIIIIAISAALAMLENYCK